MDARLAQFKAPKGYAPAPSSVEGIVVFAPLPEEEELPDAPITAKCPNCGSSMAFDPRTQALTCEACGTTKEKARAVGNIAGAAANDFTLDALRRGARGWGVERKVLHCGNCGSDMVVEPGSLATTCPFCASNSVELVAGDPDAVRPGFVLPFQMRPDALEKSVKLWLAGGWMHPGSLKDLARIDRFVGVYIPYWLFDATAHAAYECEVGTDRQVTRTDSNGRSYTETVTDWKWTKGTLDRRWTGVLVPGTGKLSKVILGRVDAKFDLNKVAAYTPEVLAGFRAQGYDVALPEAWTSGKARIRDLARSACESHAGGDHVRNMSMTAAMGDELWRYALLPVYVTAYKFQDRVFQVMVNGQTGDVEGQKPVVWGRIYALIVLMFLPAICSGVLGVPLMLLGVGFAVLFVGLVFLILAMAGARQLWQAAAAKEAA